MTAIKKMPEVAKAKLNGEAPKTPVVDNKILVVRPNNTEKKEVEEPKKEQLLLMEGKKETPSISLDDVIVKNQMVSDLIYRREKFMDSLKKLRAFKLQKDGVADSITIKDGHGNEFKTTNSAAIKDCIDGLVNSLQTKLQAVEAQILA